MHLVGRPPAFSCRLLHGSTALDSLRLAGSQRPSVPAAQVRVRPTSFSWHLAQHKGTRAQLLSSAFRVSSKSEACRSFADGLA